MSKFPFRVITRGKIANLLVKKFTSSVQRSNSCRVAFTRRVTDACHTPSSITGLNSQKNLLHLDTATVLLPPMVITDDHNFVKVRFSNRANEPILTPENWTNTSNLMSMMGNVICIGAVPERWIVDLNPTVRVCTEFLYRNETH